MLFKMLIIRIKSTLILNLELPPLFLIRIFLKSPLIIKILKMNSKLCSAKMESFNGTKLKKTVPLNSIIKMFYPILLEMFVVYGIKIQSFLKNKELKILTVAFHSKTNLMIWFLSVLPKNTDVLVPQELFLNLSGKDVLNISKRMLLLKQPFPSLLTKKKKHHLELFCVLQVWMQSMVISMELCGFSIQLLMPYSLNLIGMLTWKLEIKKLECIKNPLLKML